MKIEHIGLKLDHGRSVRRGGAGLGRPALVGGQAAHSWASFGPTLASIVLVPLLSDFHDFRDRISFHYRGVLPPHLFFIYLYAKHVETNMYTKEIESR